MEKNPSGYLSLVLHCHLPFVRHPEHEYFLEENWYFEALFETYLPLLSVFQDLSDKKIPFHLTLSVSPTLLSMCLDPLLQERAYRYVDELIELALKERKRVESQPEFQPVVAMYLDKLRATRALLERYGGNVAAGWKEYQLKGNLEIITCAATHAYLPLLAVHENALRAQVETAVEFHRSFFGRPPAGFWLPECGYQPGLDGTLAESGLGYFFVESHGLLQSIPAPKAGTFAPLTCRSGLSAFARDPESSKQVWSAEEGYPGHPDYREFYRDVGFDLSEGHLHPYLRPDGLRRFTGLKYYRVTGSTVEKQPYDPARALERAAEHAADFLRRRQRQVEEVSQWMDRPPLVSCLYDAELFGHWWYEGPDFLRFLFEKNQAQGEPLAFVTPSEYLRRHPDNPPGQPVFSSWGLGGYSEFWLNEANDWIYPPLNGACDEMTQLADRFPEAKGLAERALNQAARELLLAQSSDWAFMLKAGHYRSYAEGRFKAHLSRFFRLSEQIRKRKIQEKFLSDLEEKDNIFPALNFRVYQTRDDILDGRR